MNLLNRKVFISDSAWICLMDVKHKEHEKLVKLFKKILDQNYKVITSSFVIDATLEALKNDFSKEIAAKFLDIVDRAVMGNYLKIYWMNRRIRHRSIDSFLLEDFASMTQATNIEIIKQKKVHAVLTLNPQLYADYNIPVINFL